MQLICLTSIADVNVVDFGVATGVSTSQLFTNATEGARVVSITAVEARHSAALRALHLPRLQSPFPSPFDVGLTFNKEYTILLGRNTVISCPASNPPLPPTKAFPNLVDSNYNATYTNGSTVTLLTPGYTLESTGALYGAFILLYGPIFVDATPVDGGFNVTVPDGVYGQSYVVLTSCNETVTDDTIAAGPAVIQASAHPLPICH